MVFMLRSSSLPWWRSRWLRLSEWWPSSDRLWSLKEDFSEERSRPPELGGGASLSISRGDEDRLKLLTLLWPVTSSVMSSSSSSSPQRLRGDHVILFSFLSLLRALANQVDTWKWEKNVTINKLTYKVHDKIKITFATCWTSIIDVTVSRLLQRGN